MDRSDEGDVPRGDARPDVAAEGGDPACWLRRICPACGRLADDDPPTKCPACGAAIPLD